jgi:hypothetical protein
MEETRTDSLLEPIEGIRSQYPFVLLIDMDLRLLAFRTMRKQICVLLSYQIGTNLFSSHGKIYNYMEAWVFDSVYIPNAWNIACVFVEHRKCPLYFLYNNASFIEALLNVVNLSSYY